MGSPRRARRRFPPLWLSAVLVLTGGAIVWFRAGDPFGDRGITNVATMLFGTLAAGLGFAWFVLRSGYSGRLRLGALVACVAALGSWTALYRLEGFDGALVPHFAPRFGGEPPAPAAAPAAAGPVALDLSPTPHDFPGFLGPRRDAAVEGVRLARDWDARPPEELWRRPVGAGWSGFAVVNGVAVTLELRGEHEVAAAYEAETGAPLWTRSWHAPFGHLLGGDGPRATPTIADGRVYVLGARGHLACLDGADGSVVWERDLLAEYGVTPEREAELVQYGRSSSPLVTAGLCVVPAGGDPRDGRMAGLVAYDADTGERVWEGPPRQTSFASPRLADLAGVPQILIVNEDSFSGHDPATGRILWEHPWEGRTSANASASQAVPLPPDRVFVSKGYGVGSSVVRIVPAEDGTFETEELWHERRALRTKLTNVVVHDGHAYGLSDGILECVEVATGRRAWRAGRYGHGQVLRVGELLLVLSEEGELVLVELSPTEPDRVLGRRPVLEGKTWNNLALYGDVLLVRNAREAAALRLAVE